MHFVDVIVNEYAFLIASFLEPQAWPCLRRTTTGLSANLHDSLLQRALVSILAQTASHLWAVRSPTKDDFQRLENSLRLIVIANRGDIRFQEAMRSIIEAVCFWFKGALRKVKGVGSETQTVHKKKRALLHDTCPRLWMAAAQAYPELLPCVSKILMKWPLNYEDRDFLVDTVGATLPAAAIPTSDLSATVVGCELAVMLSCGSERRVAILERANLSTKVVEALKQHDEQDDVIPPAMGYLFNVAQCKESWQTLRQLELEPVCRNALQRFPEHPLVQECAPLILDILSAVDYGSES